MKQLETSWMIFSCFAMDIYSMGTYFPHILYK